MDLQKGDKVKVRALGKQVLARRFVEIRGRTALICSDEEYQKALKDRRQPICIGFPIEEIIEVISEGRTKSVI